jgi:phosphodiesterase/alkaline phosphatase D-like protein
MGVRLQWFAYVVIGVTAMLCASAPAVHALSPELKCQDAIAVQARNYFKKRYSAVAKCEDKRSSGNLDQLTNCRPDVGPVTDDKTDDKLSNAATKLGDKLDLKCTNAIVAGLTLGRPCGTVATVTEVTNCILDDAHGHNSDLLIETVYDDAGELSGSVCVGGTNNGGACDPDAPLATECPGGGTECREAKAIRLCQKAFSSAGRNYAKDRMSARRSCAKSVEAGKSEGPCPDDKARLKLDKALEKFRKKVLKKCTDADAQAAAANFGFPCDSFINVTFERDGVTNNNLIPPVERLVRCIAAGAAGDGDLGADTVYPLPDATPFSFGVAAGDATESAFMAWTRTDGPGDVTLEYDTDGTFASPTSVGPLTPDGPADNTVKVEVTGLTAGTKYFYRFSQGAQFSRVGQIRTAPLGVATGTVNFVWTGDSNAFFRPYTVLNHIIADDPEVWLYIGDTIYGDDPRSGTGVATTRADYHDKYKENRSDHSLRDVMASFGTLTMWDDHEVTNDFWGTDPGVATQMAEGNQAFRDYMPIRDDTGDAMQLYRSFRWGQAAEFFLIDARQYRDSQAYVTEPACAPGGTPAVLPNATCQAEIDNPSRTYLGAAQKAWLKAGLLSTTATFKFVMNGPLISELLFVPYDRWEGYAAEREEILEFIAANDIKNVIFLSTDIHALIVNGFVANPGGSGGGIREWVSGAIGMDPIFRELPAAVATFVPQLPLLFPTVTHFDIDRFNYALVEASPTAAEVTYRDNTGAVIANFSVLAEQ